MIACKFKNSGCKREMKRAKLAAHENDHFSKTLVELQVSNSQLQASNSQLQASNSQLQASNSQLQASNLQLEDSNSQLEDSNSQIETSNSQLLDSNYQLHEEMLDFKEELNGTLKNGQSITFKITGFQGKKDSDEIFASPFFYTSPGGYHMAIRVFTNGDGSCKGTHVSVNAPILDGKYDTELKWPFVGKVTFSLLNQLEDYNHVTHILPIDLECNATVGKCWGFKEFIPHSELAHDPVENTQYLKDDTLYFRVSVEVSDHKPWLECAIK